MALKPESHEEMNFVPGTIRKKIIILQSSLRRHLTWMAKQETLMTTGGFQLLTTCLTTGVWDQPRIKLWIFFLPTETQVAGRAFNLGVLVPTLGAAWKIDVKILTTARELCWGTRITTPTDVLPRINKRFKKI